MAAQSLDTAISNKVSLANALDKMIIDRSLGENGMIQISTNGMCHDAESTLTALYFSLVRGCDQSIIDNLFNIFINSLTNLEERDIAEYCRYLLILMFQTRDPRGGKGERAIFRYLLLKMYSLFPKTIELLIHYIPHFGCWRDLNDIALEIYGKPQFESLLNVIYNNFSEQLQTDKDNYDEWLKDKSKHHNLTLVAKWAVKEGSSVDKKIKMSKELSKRIFHLEFTQNYKLALKKYRHLLVELNQAINTTEVYMCDKRFKDIDFNLVPGKCLKKNVRAFLNVGLLTDELRFPNDMDRNTCRQNLIEFMDEVKMGKKKINAGSLFIHEIIEELYNHIVGKNKLSDEEIELYELSWNSIINTYSELIKKNEIHLNEGVVLADISGSMSGTPMMVSISCAIFISSLLNNSYKNKFMTFESTPQWYHIPESMTLLQKVKHILESPWGGSTNFEKALNLILEVAEHERLIPEQLPQWFLVVSDMAFDVANNNQNWKTMYELLVEKFSITGLKVCGRPYQIPHFIFWNVRNTSSNGFPVVHDQEGCNLISGFSIAILKEIFKTKDLSSITPWKSLKSTLDSARYEIIRDVISNYCEKPYFNYFTQTNPVVVSPRVITPEPKNKSFLGYFSNFFT